MAVIIRKATLSDAESIASVHVKSWQTSYVGLIDQSFLDNISYDKRLALRKEILKSDNSLHLVAIVDEQIIGFADAGPVRPECQAKSHPLFKEQEATMGEIYALYLLEQHKGTGCGKALFRKCFSLLSQEGFKSFVVWALTDNVRARRFYENEGGTPIGEMTIAIGDKNYQEVCYLFSTTL